MDLSEYQKIRNAFGSTNAKFAKALELSTATVYKLGFNEPISIALRLKYAGRLRALTEKIAAEHTPASLEVVDEVDADAEALRFYNQITAGAAALYRMAKQGNVSARRSASARGVPSSVAEKAAQSIALAQEKQRIKDTQERNRQRAYQRPAIQQLQAELVELARTAGTTGDWGPYQARLYSVSTVGDPQFLLEFLGEARERVIAADDPLVTLPDETL